MRRMIRSALLGVVLLALIGTFGGPGDGLASQSEVVIAVARFDNRSGSGLANVGEGLADMLTEELVNAGYRVVERAEIESVLLEQGLNPLVTGDLAQAAQIVGADLLFIGSVSQVDIQERSVSLGFVTVSGATVTVELSLRLVSVYTTEIMDATSVQAQAEGQTGFSLNVGRLLSMLSGWRANVCTGGFLSDKASYAQGEMVNFGYSPAAPGNYTVSVYDSSGTTWIWGASRLNSAPGGCVTFSWDGREFWWPHNPVPPGSYVAYLCSGLSCSPGDPNLLASRNFTILSMPPPAWMSEFTVGTEQFEGTIIGQAVDAALDELLDRLGNMISQIEPQILAQRSQTAQPVERLKGRVLELWEDGTIVIGLGREDGVQQYDVFEVFDAREVRDPDTGELIEVVPVTDAPKGEILVRRAEERVSLADQIGEVFQVNIGDLVIRKQGG